MRELLAPLEQTARLCGMQWLAPFVVHGTHLLSETDLTAAASDYARVLRALRDGHVRLVEAESQQRLNANLDLVLGDAP